MDLSQRQLPILSLGTQWFRLHSRNRNPLYFGASGDNRFDAPHGEYGVLYVGSDVHSAFIETFGQSTGINNLTTSSLLKRSLCRIEAKRDLSIVDLTGPGLARLGADERLCSGETVIAQRWALALWNHPSAPDGLYYRARHDPSRYSLAVFDRAGSVLEPHDLGHLLDRKHAPLLADILDTYDFALLNDIGP